MASAFYLANMFNMLLILSLIAFVWAMAVLFIGFLDKAEPFFDDDAEIRRIERKKRNRTALIVAIISGLLCLTVPTGKTYLKMKAANAVGEECTETLFDLIDQKLMKVVQEADLVDYD